MGTQDKSKEPSTTRKEKGGGAEDKSSSKKELEPRQHRENRRDRKEKEMEDRIRHLDEVRRHIDNDEVGKTEEGQMWIHHLRQEARRDQRRINILVYLRGKIGEVSELPEKEDREAQTWAWRWKAAVASFEEELKPVSLPVIITGKALKEGTFGNKLVAALRDPLVTKRAFTMGPKGDIEIGVVTKRMEDLVTALDLLHPGKEMRIDTRYWQPGARGGAGGGKREEGKKGEEAGGEWKKGRDDDKGGSSMGETAMKQERKPQQRRARWGYMSGDMGGERKRQAGQADADAATGEEATAGEATAAETGVRPEAEYTKEVALEAGGRTKAEDAKEAAVEAGGRTKAAEAALRKPHAEQAEVQERAHQACNTCETRLEKHGFSKKQWKKATSRWGKGGICLKCDPEALRQVIQDTWEGGAGADYQPLFEVATKALRNTRTKEGTTALMIVAAGGGDVGENVQRILRLGADVLAKDDEGWTALHWASFHGNLRGVQALVQGGGKNLAGLLMARNERGDTAEDIVREGVNAWEAKASNSGLLAEDIQDGGGMDILLTLIAATTAEAVKMSRATEKAKRDWELLKREVKRELEEEDVSGS